MATPGDLPPPFGVCPEDGDTRPGHKELVADLPTHPASGHSTATYSSAYSTEVGQAGHEKRVYSHLIWVEKSITTDVGGYARMMIIRWRPHRGALGCFPLSFTLSLLTIFIAKHAYLPCVRKKIKVPLTRKLFRALLRECYSKKSALLQSCREWARGGRLPHELCLRGTHLPVPESGPRRSPVQKHPWG